MTDTVNTFVIYCEGRGAWFVGDNNDAIAGSFRNWVLATDYAREHAVKEDANIVQLSADGKRVVRFLKPRVSVSAVTRKGQDTPVGDENDTTVGDENDTTVDDENEVTETSLNALSTPELVAVYNENGGNITGKFKGARKTLVAKILAAA